MTNDWETIEVQSIIDENARLKQQLKTKVIVNKQYEELQRLKQENEEFKKALVELKEIGDYQEGRIKELSDENDQLQEELLQCKAVIDNRWSEYLQKKELDV